MDLYFSNLVAVFVGNNLYRKQFLFFSVIFGVIFSKIIENEFHFAIF